MHSFVSQLKQQKVAVVGFGVTGLASAKFLCEQGVSFTWVDSRKHPSALAEAESLKVQYGERIDLAYGDAWTLKLQDCEFVIASPGVPVGDIQACCPNAEIVSDITVFAHCIKQPIIAITGSNGKSTVTKLVAHLLNSAGLKAQMGGNIGIPALSIAETEFDVAVLELSSFQLEITPPLVYRSAAFLNVSKDHMDRYESFEAYVQAKQRIYPQAELAVFNVSDECTKPQQLSTTAQSRAFAFDAIENAKSGEAAYCNGEALYLNEDVICSVADLQIAGQHNIANALAALLLVSPWQLGKEALRKGLMSFKGLSHRCQVVRSNDDIRWINDSKATNVGATVAALQGLKRSTKGALHLLLGGDGKSADFSMLTDAAFQFADSVVCYGRDASEIESFLQNKEVTRVNSFDDALNFVKQKANAGDTVLLSPACASFDEFKGFEARGNAFVAFIQGEGKQ